jgi:hypothetical protein
MTSSACPPQVGGVFYIKSQARQQLAGVPYKRWIDFPLLPSLDLQPAMSLQTLFKNVSRI